MVTQALIDYIQKMIKSGLWSETVLQQLMQKGWKKEDIEVTLKMIQSHNESEDSLQGKEPFISKTSNISNEKHIPIPLFKKITMILVDPISFFEEINFEKKIWRSLVYLLILFLFSYILRIIIWLTYTVLANWDKNPDLFKNDWTLSIFKSLLYSVFIFQTKSFLFFIVTVISLILIISLLAFILNKLFKGQGSFFDLLRICIYGFSPLVIIQIFSWLDFFDKLMIVNVNIGNAFEYLLRQNTIYINLNINYILVWSLILISIGFQKITKLNNWKSIFSIVIPFSLILFYFIITFKIILISGFVSQVIQF
ncbi:hypothetical protein A2X44_04730 [candidate division CPR3 bacterium GWF2_35_18]|uniref:Yip1 domain-containing protein n=1 Tax=candidate division CPR3 bacterium GW2011_GWF2_35_18 TaxID=1618350 RepID=A0A0G0E3A2_UNCC3|nr:MAG: hypothetical protein UR67_C0003G0028 [candidate division CPR3 bacterium GW2011_GWF2_35_18]KKP86698.1 MAG: hypothetical protein UR87_C0013G0015 [candidate division CPR3 bacterium GW2011_GWE2_35_7]OGB63639.1 MAG: hypothetical protein A2X44_04730 [candidate division CPR3 bacterium GWF2_35_18]OGB75728.1 MAG: hypothetical protein A2476_03430 [candidate division CPR3 bacterium RIFOXYC2_FULL_35_7]OGB78369.1 MAG: hypothetical protein A2296_02710 [candidate division CPR3 bacterium RIFOXYB2_FULL_